MPSGGGGPLVAIIGRPNVGKSTLFNRILGHRSAIVDDVPGVTRDRNYSDASFRGRPFRLVDTGGLDPSAKEGMLALIRHQTQIAIAEADILLFVMDGRAGVTPPDEAVVQLLRGVRKPVVYAVNKIDTTKSDPLVSDFYRLGIDPIFLSRLNTASAWTTSWKPSTRTSRRHRVKRPAGRATHRRGRPSQCR